MKRFLKKLFLHPGTWILGALAAVGIAMAAPAAAAALVIIAGVAVVVAVPMTGVWIGDNLKALQRGRKDGKLFDDWIKAHPAQFAAMLFAAALFITALVLTIGFFTGGAGFLFMAPVFAALAAPFATTAAASLGISLFIPALTGFCFVIAGLNLGNTLDRFLSWLDSFKYDGAMAYSIEKARSPQREDAQAQQQGDQSNLIPKVSWDAQTTLSQASRETETEAATSTHGYYRTVFKGISTVVSNGCLSEYEAQIQDGDQKADKADQNAAAARAQANRSQRA